MGVLANGAGACLADTSGIEVGCGDSEGGVAPVLYHLAGSPVSGVTFFCAYVGTLDRRFARIVPPFVVTISELDAHKNAESESDKALISLLEFELYKRDPQFRSYVAGPRWYGFFSQDLEYALTHSQHVVLPVSDAALSRDLQAAYPQVRHVRVFLHCDPYIAQGRVAVAGAPLGLASAYRFRAAAVWAEYDPHHYDVTIINHASKERFIKVIDALFARFSGARRLHRSGGNDSC